MKVIYTMASFNREQGLNKVVPTILPQCTDLWVYLNEYQKVPKILNHKKIKVFRSQDYGECGDIGKFHDTEKIQNAYHFTVDDDILYPKNYTEVMIGRIEKYDRSAVIAVHGALVYFPCQNYYRHRHHYHFRTENTKDVIVNVVGTGTVAFHSDTIKTKRSDFKKKNMADIWFSLLAQDQKVSLVVIKRNQNWMRPCPSVDYVGSIHQKSKNQSHGQYQTQILNDYHKKFGVKIYEPRKVKDG
jgi:hypothetical protein